MTRCSDSGENCTENPDRNQKKRKKVGKHVSFPPDEQIVSGFAEDAGRTGELLFNCTFS